MNKFTHNRSFLVATLLAAFAATACANSDDEGGRDGATGTLSAQISVSEEAKHDVAYAHFVVVPAGGSCTDIPIAETTGVMEDEELQANLDPSGTASGRAFIDGFMVLPPGDYMICATPLQENGVPSEECAMATAEVTVTAEVTTNVTLVSQCEGDPNGGVNPVLTFNDPPLIEDVNIGPSKFIDTCQTAELEVIATDPNDDALSYDWEVLSGPEGYTLIENGATAQLTPGAAGDYEVRVTVYDALGGVAHLDFPVHVAQADGECGEPAACPSGSYDAGGYCWVVAEDYEEGDDSCARFGLNGAQQNAEGVEWTPELMQEVSDAIGCTNIGDVSDFEPSLWFDTQTNECFTNGFSSETGQYFQQAGFPIEDWQDAVHVCDRPE